MLLVGGEHGPDRSPTTGAAAAAAAGATAATAAAAGRDDRTRIRVDIVGTIARKRVPLRCVGEIDRVSTVFCPTRSLKNRTCMSGVKRTPFMRVAFS